MPQHSQLFGRETLTIEELEATAAFKVLNDQQKTFVRVWVESSGDQVFAATQAYQMADPETARKSSYDIIARKSIRKVLDQFLCKTEKELFLDEVDRILRSKNPTNGKLRALEIKAQLLFGVDLQTMRRQRSDARRAEVKAARQTAKSPKPECRVGDVINYGGKTFRVTKIDEKGRPVEGDPVTA